MAQTLRHVAARRLRQDGKLFLQRLAAAWAPAMPDVVLSVAVPRVGDRPLNQAVFRTRCVEFARTWFPESRNPVITADYARSVELVRATYAPVPASQLFGRISRVHALAIVLARDATWVEIEISGGGRLFTSKVSK